MSCVIVVRTCINFSSAKVFMILEIIQKIIYSMYKRLKFQSPPPSYTFETAWT
jgi:hypothetical protein